MQKNQKPKKIRFISYLGMFYYYCFALASMLWKIIFKVKINKTQKFKEAQKKPMVLFANHVSTHDLMIIGNALFPKKQNFVVAEQMLFRSRFHHHILTQFGAILKKQFYSDFSCVRNIKKNLMAGISVVLCPEGKVSDDGITQPISFSNAKLIKWLGYPVGILNNHGGGMIHPKWSDDFRYGKVKVDCDILLDENDTKNLSEEKIFELLKKGLYNNDHKYQVENNIKFKTKKPALGLDRILYKCPKCGSEFDLYSTKHHLICKACGNKASYDCYGKILPYDDKSIVFERIDLWRNFEREEIRKELLGEKFLFECEVDHYVEPAIGNGKWSKIDNGKLIMDKENISYYPNDKNIVKFSLANLLTIASKPDKSANLYFEGKAHKFVFTGKNKASKLTLAVEENAKIIKLVKI